MRVLMLAANPPSTERLRIDRELRQIEEKIRAARYRSSVQITARWAVRLDDLQHALLDLEPSVVHWSGHGSAEHELLLENDSGECSPVSWSALAHLFGILGRRIRVVVLNACNSRAQAEALVDHVDCAIGMSDRISDEAAIEFSAAFYQAIGFGKSIQTAFDLGVSALKIRRTGEEHVLQLFQRRGLQADDVVLLRATEPEIAGGRPPRDLRQVLIPEGTFWMGSPEGAGEPHERPRHEVHLAPFSISDTPITQAQYAASSLGPAAERGAISAERADHPIVMVSWFDAARYCNRLSAQHDLEPFYHINDARIDEVIGSNGYRLPSEAEWERACRAGTMTSWCTGDGLRDLSAVSWYGEGAGASTRPVGQKRANAQGLYDMHGHVLEWCGDWYGPYDARPQVNPRGPASGAARVVRGGSAWGSAERARSAFRDYMLPRHKARHLGFRVVRPALEGG